MRYDGVLMCSDFDGTLAVNSTVSKENIEAIKMFQANGGRFTLATGRTPQHIAESVPELAPNAPMISVNGAVLFDSSNQKELIKIPVGDTSAFAKEIFCHPDCNMVRMVCGDYSTVAVKRDDKAPLVALERALKLPLLKLVYVFNSTAAPLTLSEQYKKEYGDRFYFSRSWEYSVEVLDINATKGALLKELKNHLTGVDLTIGVGDFDNDVPLVKEADIGYAVENAVDAVKQAADRTTVSFKDSAIAKIIYEL